MERYHVAAAQAKTKGDQRKARMHERIVKVCRGPSGWVGSPRRPGPGGPNTVSPSAIPRHHPSPQGWPSRGCDRAAGAPG